MTWSMEVELPKPPPDNAWKQKPVFEVTTAKITETEYGAGHRVYFVVANSFAHAEERMASFIKFDEEIKAIRRERGDTFIRE